MKILVRYFSHLFLKNFAAALGALTTLFVLQTILGGVVGAAYPTDQVITYHLMKTPQILSQMIPPAVLVATVVTLAGLNRSHELTACYSIGIGLYQITTILLSLVFMICCASLIIQDRVLPPVFKKRTTYFWRTMKKRNDFFLDVKKDKIWYRSGKYIYNLKTFDPASNTIRGMSVYQFSDQFDLVGMIEADRAVYTTEGWDLRDGTVTEFFPDSPFPETTGFDKKKLTIEETPKDFQEIEKEVDGLRIKELYSYINRLDESGIDTKAYSVKLHSRLSISFIPLVMCLLGIPFSTRMRRQGGLGKDLGICLGITFFYWLFFSIGLSMGKSGVLPPWLSAWGPSFVFLAFAGSLLTFREKI
ncbi:MAG: LPS export ABC transporter permease LptG [Bdellovibrionaceae bacterium]|nr:LPS export ABC transporter permease LptG [Pseudobdellovibrionaceae bacterium]|tara:strand:- start:499 stop:1578 length:1080 start_codon:yes stop_codon:yes gene_type:complete